MGGGKTLNVGSWGGDKPSMLKPETHTECEGHIRAVQLRGLHLLRLLRSSPMLAPVLGLISCAYVAKNGTVLCTHH